MELVHRFLSCQGGYGQDVYRAHVCSVHSTCLTVSMDCLRALVTMVECPVMVDILRVLGIGLQSSCDLAL